MTLKNRYDEVMKNIEVTDEMRDRILNNIDTLDFEKPPKKVISFPRYKKYLSIAACLVVLLASTWVLYNSLNSPNIPEPPVLVTPGIVEFNSAGELSDAVGFTIRELGELPFDTTDVKYTAYWGEIADIEYTGANNSARFRMASGDEDVSGDSTEYTNIKSLATNGFEVTLKGNNGGYVIALWQAEGYSYSLQFIEAVPEQEMLTVIQSMR